MELLGEAEAEEDLMSAAQGLCKAVAVVHNTRALEEALARRCSQRRAGSSCSNVLNGHTISSCCEQGHKLQFCGSRAVLDSACGTEAGVGRRVECWTCSDATSG